MERCPRTGKVQHRSEQDATTEAKRMNRKHPSPAGFEMVAYQCARCGRWHIGHPEKRLDKLVNNMPTPTMTMGDE